MCNVCIMRADKSAKGFGGQKRMEKTRNKCTGMLESIILVTRRELSFLVLN